MGRVNTPTLTPSQRQELERGLKEGKSHSFRMRCQSILLKSEGRTSKEVSTITGMCDMSVNSWLSRYKSEGLSGLFTKSGRGRKPVLKLEEDKFGILEAIKTNRQRMRTAKAECFTLTGYTKREKDNDFWDIPFDRRHTSFVIGMNNTFTLSKSPDLKLTVSGFYQNGSIQGIYDLSRSGNLDASLQWTSQNQRAKIALKGMDLFNTSQVSTKTHFNGQNVNNDYIQTNRGFQLSFSYRFGDYKEKKRESVDTSRFK